MRSGLFLAATLLVVAACQERPASDELASAEGEVVSVVDSVIPMDEALRRFRADLEEATALRAVADTREGLVGQIIRALAASDTLKFETLAVNRSEWSWLYYPTNVLAKPPYELPPGLAWLQLQEANRKGVFRALRELGGHELAYRGHTCAAAPIAEGANRIWTDCTVTVGRDGSEPVTLRLFGAILERDGRFLVLSYDNDF